MRPAHRRFDPGLIDQLLESPQRFEFFQAVRVLERHFGRRTHDREQRDTELSDRIRFRNSVTLGFAPSQIESMGAQFEPVDASDANGHAGRDAEKTAVERTARRTSRSRRLSSACWAPTGRCPPITPNRLSIASATTAITRYARFSICSPIARWGSSTVPGRNTASPCSTRRIGAIASFRWCFRCRGLASARCAIACAKRPAASMTSRSRVSPAYCVSDRSRRPPCKTCLNATSASRCASSNSSGAGTVRCRCRSARRSAAPTPSWAKLCLPASASGNATFVCVFTSVRLLVAPTEPSCRAAEFAAALEKLLHLATGAQFEYEIRPILRAADVKPVALSDEGGARLGLRYFRDDPTGKLHRSDTAFELHSIR